MHCTFNSVKMSYPKRALVWSGLVLGCLHAFTAASPALVSRASVLSSVDVANKTYDFVVVGGGTAGLTVADRLSENPESRQ